MDNTGPKVEGGEIIATLSMKAEDAPRVKAVKLSDQELVKVQAFQDYLHGIGCLEENTFASLFRYLFNLGYTKHLEAYDTNLKKEVQPA